MKFPAERWFLVTLLAIALLATAWRYNVIDLLWNRYVTQSNALTDADIEGYLDNLAVWANENHVAIRINGLPINTNFGAVGGWDYVGWKNRPGAFDETPEAAHARANLKKLLDQSTCKRKTIDPLIRALTDWQAGEGLLTPEELASRLACIGTFTFEKVTFSPY